VTSSIGDSDLFDPAEEVVAPDLIDELRVVLPDVRPSPSTQELHIAILGS
jgi:hypothetical protein